MENLHERYVAFDCDTEEEEKAESWSDTAERDRR